LNLLLALASAALLILAFPRFQIAWLAPVALAPLLIAAMRERRPIRRFFLGWISGVLYWFGVCYWIQFVLAFHGGMGEAAGWAVFTLFAVVKALHMGVFAWLAGIVMRRWWAVPATAALWVAIEATHGFLGFAWLALGNAGIDMAVPMRLAPITGVYGLSFVFAAAAATLALAILGRPRAHMAWLLALPALLLLPKMPPAGRGHSTALLVQPNLSETADWTAESLEKMLVGQLSLTLQGASREAGSRPRSWPGQRFQPRFITTRTRNSGTTPALWRARSTPTSWWAWWATIAPARRSIRPPWFRPRASW